MQGVGFLGREGEGLGTTEKESLGSGVWYRSFYGIYLQPAVTGPIQAAQLSLQRTN